MGNTFISPTLNSVLNFQPNLNFVNDVTHIVMTGNANSTAFEKYGLDSNDYPGLGAGVPMCSVMAYMLLVMYLSPPDNKGPRTGGFKLKVFSVVHNLSMTIFSLVTFLYMFPVFYEGVFVKKLDMAGMFCGQVVEHWDRVSLWSWLFYLSKIYEFVDTFTVIAKNRRPIMLQTFHHVGAVVIMWGLMKLNVPTMLVFVLMNSFVHTVMYFYYLMTTLGIRLTAFKPLITGLQLAQFLVGQYWVWTTYFVPGCLNPGQVVIVAFSQLYVFVLVIMFLQFFYDNYVKKPQKSSLSTAKKVQ
eukprot:175369_1